MLKIGVVYTGLPPALLEDVNREIARVLPGCVVMSFSDPSILSEIIEEKKITPAAAARLIGLYHAAEQAGAGVILNGCSSVGDIAAEAAPLFARMGVPIVRIDERMAEIAVRDSKIIAVVATLPSTLEPTKRLVLQKAGLAQREIELIELLVDNAYGKSPAEMTDLIFATVEPVAGKADTVLLAQASMYPSAAELSARLGIPTFSSPPYGAAALKDAVCELRMAGDGVNGLK